MVGSRVVVRRILPGREGRPGEPAFTDVLGILEGWDTEARVRREDGTLEVFPTALVVAGKPVPERPKVRLRVSALDAERHTARLWRGVEVKGLGDWELRHEPRPTGRRRKRANSALAMGDPGLELPAAAYLVREHYERLGLEPLAQVEIGSEQEDFFVADGWRAVDGDAHFLLGSVATVRRRLLEASTPVELSLTGNGATASIGTGCDPVAEGTATLAGDWLGLHGFEVDPAHRRRGHATALVASLTEWGAEHGATHVWLHVETGNQPAMRLYEGLGLQVHHTCRYYAY